MKDCRGKRKFKTRKELVLSLGAEFSESLVSDSKGRVSRSRTRLGLGFGFVIQGCSRIGLGLGLVITFCAVLVSEWGHKI